MPLVDREIQDPSDWASVSSSIGFVRDGDQLRCWKQPAKGQGESLVVSAADWKAASDPRVTSFKQALKDGAWASVGIPPSMGLVRELHSPFSDSSKSNEIWPSLLEAEVPFALEDCAVSFLPACPSKNGGQVCLAAAARLQDLDAVVEEWKELGIQPDALLPEALLLYNHDPASVWMGQERTVLTAGTEDQFFAATGCASRGSRDKTVSRFQTVWSSEYPDLGWSSSGPEGEGSPEALEQEVAAFLLGKGPKGGSLCDAAHCSPRLKAGFRQRINVLLAGSAVLLALLVAGPLVLVNQLRGQQQVIRKQIANEYLALTGEVSPAPGQEVLLANRYMEDQLGDLMDARAEVGGPQLTERLLRVFFTVSRMQMNVVSLEADPSGLTVIVATTAPSLEVLQKELESFGDQVNVSSSGEGSWRVEVLGL